MRSPTWSWIARAACGWPHRPGWRATMAKRGAPIMAAASSLRCPRVRPTPWRWTAPTGCGWRQRAACRGWKTTGGRRSRWPTDCRIASSIGWPSARETSSGRRRIWGWGALTGRRSMPSPLAWRSPNSRTLTRSRGWLWPPTAQSTWPMPLTAPSNGSIHCRATARSSPPGRDRLIGPGAGHCSSMRAARFGRAWATRCGG